MVDMGQTTLAVDVPVCAAIVQVGAHVTGLQPPVAIAGEGHGQSELVAAQVSVTKSLIL
jgi:hypothetical protein